MNAPNLDQRRRAWELAHKLLSLIPWMQQRQDADLLALPTAQACKAMGMPDGAKLEEVRDFLREVTSFLRGYDMFVACGCGYLSLKVGVREAVEQAHEEGRDLVEITLDDVDAAFETFLRDRKPGDPFVCRFGDEDQPSPAGAGRSGPADP